MAAAAAPAGASQKHPEQLPLNFGKRLAHTDKAVRDKGFAVLKAWLKKHPELERLDYMKLWKGLHFGMWMADKRPVQQELAVNIALLFNDIPGGKRIMWMDAAWETLEESWEKLDTHRMNKYMLLVRIITAEFFKVLREAGWVLEDVQAASRIFTRATAVSGITGPNVHSLGLLLHFCRLFWDELRPQLEEKPQASSQAIMALLEPFLALAEASYSDALVKNINEFLLRCAPDMLKGPLLERATEGMAKAGVPKKNRLALKETARTLGAELSEPEPEEKPRPKRKAFGSYQPKEKKEKKKKVKKPDGEQGKGASNANDTMSPLLLPPALGSKPGGEAAGGKRKKKGGKAGAGADAGSMSPLTLPRAAPGGGGAAAPRSGRALKRATRRVAKEKNALVKAKADAPRRKRKVPKAKSGDAPRPMKKKKKVS